MTGCLSLKIIVGLICGHYITDHRERLWVCRHTSSFPMTFSKMYEVPMYTAIWQE